MRNDYPRDPALKIAQSEGMGVVGEGRVNSGKGGLKGACPEAI